MAGIDDRLGDIERRLARIERTLFGEEVQREAVRRQTNADQGDTEAEKEAVPSQQQAREEKRAEPEPEPECQAGELAVPMTHVGGRTIDLADAVELVDDPVAGITEELVANWAPDTSGGRLVAEVAGLGASAITGQLHPAVAIANAGLKALEPQPDIAYPAWYDGGRQVQAEHDEPELEA